jgi:hypothetical protein
VVPAGGAGCRGLDEIGFLSALAGRLRSEVIKYALINQKIFDKIRREG